MQTIALMLPGLAAVGALVFTQKSIEATHDELGLIRDQLAVTERGQVSDRFGRAVEQLGADALDVRLGGIYALERLMRDSPDEQPTVVEVLSAYVRSHAPRTSKPARSRRHGKLPVRLAADVEAALTVLGRRDHDYDRGTRTDLTDIDLADVYLPSARLEGADLSGADLTGAYLFSADLSGADLTGAYLVGTYLVGADLPRAYLFSADLTGAHLVGRDDGYPTPPAADLTCVRIDEDTVLPAGMKLPPRPPGGCM